MKISRLSTKTTFKSLTTETTKTKANSFLIGLFTVVVCCMPFVHVFYPNTQNKELIAVKKSYKKGELTRSEYISKKRDVTYFGYDNERKLFYAIGKPITMLYFSVLLMYASFYINEKSLANALKKASVLGTVISFYFVVWAFWYMADFPQTLYYIAIGIIAILATLCSHEFIRSRNFILSKIKILTEHIAITGKKHVPVEKRKEYVEDYLKTFDKVID